MRRINQLLLAVLGVLLCAGQQAPHFQQDLFLAEIAEVTGGGKTHGDPPRVLLAVREVLAGDPKIDRSNAVWLPPWHGVDFGGAEGARIVDAWKAQPLEPPAVGSRWVVFGRTDKDTGVTYIDARGRAVDTPEARKKAPMNRSPIAGGSMNSSRSASHGRAQLPTLRPPAAGFFSR